ncbi:phosphomannomutase/phosphoglucomutase [Planifilum fimeticola]|uniref:Phosphomannomutase/phosphoglucomutase n=1 Tax=Planifilum fimeticola TaxID=201975 RepID=A0A2T0LGE4_9BACL|nr:phosphomannomutase/phosphoglucomutase [Planifilum fimeticola]PRX41329.1 phosphomannomutase/phosphoglucomutase [Planifilum fimeticola]
MSAMMKPADRIAPHVFREYDIRGIVGEEIHEFFAYWLGRAFARRVRAEGQHSVVVGRDNRKSSPALARAVTAGLVQEGCEVMDIGEVTSPMFYFGLEHLDVPSGIMITASHNPPDENGFKVAQNKTTLYGNAVKNLYNEMVGVAAETGLEPEIAQTSPSRSVDLRTPYLDMLQEKIRLDGRPLKVVVDCGNGTASSFAPEALERWGCEVIPLYCTSDPTFPNHHPDPVDPKNLTDLIRTVKETGADLGIAFDGDGDRLGVVDETGRIRWGDQLMILYWREILPKYPGCDAWVEVKCSQALVEEIKRLGGNPRFHRTGHSHVKATLRRTRAPFAGEMSGHLFFNDEYYGFDDALYAAGRLLRILSRKKRPLSALFADVPQYHATSETRVPCEEAKKASVIEQVKAHFAKKYPIVEVDGARIQFPSGWALVRSSNTQPILVLRAEADSTERLVEIKREVESVIRRCGITAPIPW